MMIVCCISLVKLPPKINFDSACAAIIPALRAYTAFHYNYRLSKDDFVLILDGAKVVIAAVFLFFLLSLILTMFAITRHSNKLLCSWHYIEELE